MERRCLPTDTKPTEGETRAGWWNACASWLGRAVRGYIALRRARPDRIRTWNSATRCNAWRWSFPATGWPRMTAEPQRHVSAVNRKGVYRLMREDNLLCLRKVKFVLTTDSHHGLPVYRSATPRPVAFLQ